MREFKLIKAIGDISDEFIEEAAPRAQNTFRYSKIAAAVAILVAGTIFGSIFLPMLGGNSSDGGIIDSVDGYLAYAGPILPLTADNPDGITATRDTNFDFQELKVQNDITISDSYTLNNNTDSDIIINASYPFISTVEEVSKLRPTITVDGENKETSLTVLEQGSPFYSGVDLSSYEGYKDYLTDENYKISDFSLSSIFDREVIVYEVTGYSGENEEYPPATIAINFKASDGYMVLGYGFTGGTGYEDGMTDLSFDVGGFNTKYIICLEDDITDIEIKGYKNGNTSDESNRLDGLYADYIKYTANLQDILGVVVEDYLQRHESGGALTLEVVLYTLSEALIDKLDQPQNSEVENSLDAYFLEDYLSYAAFSAERIFYSNFEVLIPAGSSVQIDSTFIKQASYNYGGMGNDELSGYTLATTLGSTLVFTEQTASIENYQNIEILTQNFGFDLDANINEVTLDLETSQYYLDIINNNS